MAYDPDYAQRELQMQEDFENSTNRDDDEEEKTYGNRPRLSDPPGDVAVGEDDEEAPEQQEDESTDNEAQTEHEQERTQLAPLRPQEEDDEDDEEDKNNNNNNDNNNNNHNNHGTGGEVGVVKGTTTDKRLQIVLEGATSFVAAASSEVGVHATTCKKVGLEQEGLPSPPVSPAPSTASGERRSGKSSFKKSKKNHHKEKSPTTNNSNNNKDTSHRNRSAPASIHRSTKDRESSKDRDKDYHKKESKKEKEKEKEAKKERDKNKTTSNNKVDNSQYENTSASVVPDVVLDNTINKDTVRSEDSASSNYDGFEDGDQDVNSSPSDRNMTAAPIATASTSTRSRDPLPFIEQPPVVEGKMPVDWNTPGVGNTNQPPRPTSEEALYVVGLAAAAAQQFDKYFGAIKNSQLENMTPLYHSNEVLAGKEPLRFTGYFTEYSLTAIKLVAEKEKNDNGSPASLEEQQQQKLRRLEEQQQQKIRRRFMERSIDGYYSVKYVQAGLIEATDHGGTAAADMIYETRILMNLRPQHPNVAPIYGVNCGGIDSFLETASSACPKAGFFFITDRIVLTLPEQIQQWRKEKDKEPAGGNSHSIRQARRTRLEERMSIAFDIASAMVFLHNRKIVYHIRPDKIGFDAKQGIVKLCNFSQARYDGMTDHQSQAITRSDDISILAYTAPEALCNAPCTTACDVYAFGIMLWELMSLRVPFEEYDRARHFHLVVQQHKRPPMNKKWNKEMRELLPGCWDPYLRYSMKTVNETLEKVLMLLNDEQNQINQQKSNRRSKIKPSTPTTSDPNEVEATATGSKREGDGQRMSRRNSTGVAEDIKLAEARAEMEQQGALQAADPPRKRAPKKKVLKRRQSASGANGLSNLKDHFKAAKREVLKAQEDEAATYAPKSSTQRSSARLSSSRSVFNKPDNSDARSLTSSASAFLRAPYKSPRRSTLSHVPANVRRQPLFRRKQEDPTVDDKAEEETEKDNEGQDESKIVESAPSGAATLGYHEPILGIHENALQLHFDQQRSSPRSDYADGDNQNDVPSSPKSVSPMRTIRKRLTSMRQVFSVKNQASSALLLDNDSHEGASVGAAAATVQQLRPPSPPAEAPVEGRPLGKTSRRASLAF